MSQRDSKTTAPWTQRDVKRVFWFGVIMGILFGWMTLPSILRVFGVTH